MSGQSRRQFVQGAGLLGAGLVVGCGRLPWQAQQPAKVYRIGLLHTATNHPDSPTTAAFRQGLHQLGYVEGQNVLVEYRETVDETDRAARAAELVRLAPDVIVVAGGNPTVRAARDATSTIPIVMAQAGVDPVATGLVASIARPGGNVTGLTQITAELAGKRLELLKETVPRVSRLGVLWPPDPLDKRVEFGEVQAAAHTLGLSLQSLAVRTPEDLAGAFEAAAREHADGLVVLQEQLTRTQRTRIAELAIQGRLPSIYEAPLFVEAGGLMAYGVDLPDLYWRAAYYVDRILKGASPAELPVERPVRFDFTINLKTAQALGLTIPPHVLMQATEIIQ